MPEPLKNMFNAQVVAALAEAFRRTYPAFDRVPFVARVLDVDWEARALKQRMRHITNVLGDYLPADYHAALGIMHKTLPLVSEIGFAKMVFPDFVRVYGLGDWEAGGLRG